MTRPPLNPNFKNPAAAGQELHGRYGSHVINADQLRLLMRPSEIVDVVTGSKDADERGITQAEMWPIKRRESRKPRGTGHGSGVYDSIKAEGYTKHVNLKLDQRGKFRIGEGGHRTGAGLELEAEGKDVWVPVHHVEPHARGWEYGPAYDKAYPQNVRPGWQ